MAGDKKLTERRVQINLDSETWEHLRRAAFISDSSIAEVCRRAIHQYIRQHQDLADIYLASIKDRLKLTDEEFDAIVAMMREPVVWADRDTELFAMKWTYSDDLDRRLDEFIKRHRKKQKGDTGESD